jgi:hypothetical protein
LTGGVAGRENVVVGTTWQKEMTMGGYPPGVTGNEFQIAGPDYEETEFKECAAKDVEWRMLTEAAERRLVTLVEELRKCALEAKPPQLPMLWSLGQSANDIRTVDFEVCPFTGDVEVTGFRGQRWWICPGCRTEHNEDADD